MIDGSEKRNSWLNLEFQSLHVIERCSRMTWLLPERKLVILCLNFTVELNVYLQTYFLGCHI